MASIQLVNLKKSFGRIEVIHGISAEIDNGHFVVLVGPSGCGKSTLLRMIAGLETITSGEVKIDGSVVNDVLPKDRDIAMVFQNYALYPHLTVAENMSFSLRMRRAPNVEISERVQHAAAMLDLVPLLDRHPRELSGGQRQRVAMGRAIVRHPKAFLFDEPLSNLDAKLRVAMRTEIKALHQRLSATSVYVTHDQVEAMTMADRIVVMNGGIVEQVGEPLTLYDRPKNVFVATFIGSPAMNLFNGRIAGNGFTTDGGLTWPIDGVRGAAEGRPAIYGIRPEHVALGSDGQEVPVRVIEPTGSQTQVNVEAGGQDMICVFHDRVDARVGEKIRIRPDPRRAFLFDRETGARLAPKG